MSTNSVVAEATPNGFKGRYIHWDGYPEGVGQAIATIVRRDGFAEAVKTLVHAHHGWSSVNGEQTQIADRDAKRFTPVPGYGMAYTDDEQPDEWITSSGHALEYAYVITPTTIQVWRGGSADEWVRYPEDDITF